MPKRTICSIALGLGIVVLSGQACVLGEVVSYRGDLTLDGGPVPSSFVIAGTFAPSFDPQTYKYEYGDAFGNLLTPQYSQAVADGNFRPIGGGATTYPDGAFSGTGFNTTGAGHLVYLFAFDNPNPDLASNFALATNPSWDTGDAPLEVVGSDASSFIFGQKAGPTIGLNVLPFPEPSALALGAVLLGVLAPQLRRASR